MLKNVKCARCVKCGKEYEAVPDLTNCSCGGILDIIYDYDYIKKNLTKEKLKSRPNTMWRYRELLRDAGRAVHARRTGCVPLGRRGQAGRRHTRGLGDESL